MTTATGAFTVEQGAEPLPGYRLEKRIGTGGYGEVWKATAPGGLAKAVKIIHGQIDGNHAVREMRSLERAKSLNHPFLLSLERIEIVDGHLLIVTELADATLKDRFDQYRAQGLPGIPREELLEYMREAADALDYLFDSHALQHLDVKPENLLLVGKHVKVADFGLLKDLQETRASLVSGLTPRYSSPEIFAGKPGRHCDQYSLAIVYQEMVSGQLPFAGNNIAALASQHVNSAPDLSALVPLERFAVGKALSKDPQHRFPNCRAFVERLMHRSSAAILTEPVPAKRSDGSLSGLGRAQAVPRRNNLPSAHVHDGQTIEIAAPEIRSLPRLPAAATGVKYRPVVFIGLGGTGGRVLSKLRQLLADRIGEAKSLPAIQFLYIDTDADAIRSVAAGPWNEGLREDEILITPLRHTQEYRSSTVSNLESVSRRWIYNVPRSLRTQGLRALGRLALLDHSDRLLDRLRQAVLKCTSSEAIATTAEETGLAFCESDPRVFVVSSIAGGTGGGMLVDAGYAVRQVLAECGFTDDEVCGVLTYGAARGSAACSFAPANAYACLEELRYFAQPGCDFPGESACGLAGFREDGPTFRSTYLFDSGENVAVEQFAGAIDVLSEYLFLSTASTASSLLDQCRRIERETPSPEPLRIRTAGLCPFAAATREDPGPLAEQLCRFLVRKWKVGLKLATSDDRVKLSDMDRLYEACDPQCRTDNQIGKLAESELHKLGINVQTLEEQIVRAATGKLGQDPRGYLANVIRASLETTPADRAQQDSAVDIALRRICTIMGSDEGLTSQRDSHIESLADLFLPAAQEIGARLGASVASWILQLVDTENARVDGARQAVTSVSEFLNSVRETALEQGEAAKEQLKLSWQSVTLVQAKAKQHRPPAKDSIAATLQTHAERMLNVLIHEAVCKALHVIDPQITSAADQLRELWKDLTQLSEQFQATASDNSAGAVPDANEDRRSPARMSTVFAARQKDLIEELDQQMAAQFFDSERRLGQILTQGGAGRTDLAARMRASARKIILRACNDASHSYLIEALAQGADQQLASLLQKCLHSATPGLLTLGGSKRLLMIVPSKLDSKRLTQEIEQLSQDEASVSTEQEGDMKLCYEIDGLSWEGIQTKLIRQRPDCPDLASRLHTRINVDWTVV